MVFVSRLFDLCGKFVACVACVACVAFEVFGQVPAVAARRRSWFEVRRLVRRPASHLR
jgi:hypothetical protein